jgi:hypothetical protein
VVASEGLEVLNWQFFVHRMAFGGVRKVGIFELLERKRQSATLRTSIVLMMVSSID